MQLEKGKAERVIVEKNLRPSSVSNTDHFRGVFTTAMCECTIITLLDDPNLNAFQPLWAGLYLLDLVDVPCILRDCTFLSADSHASLSNFSFK